MNVRIAVEREQIAEFCRRHHICKFAFFGSVLREDFRPESDVDVLVEFEADHVPGLIRLSGIALELSAILGRDADLRTLSDLSCSFRAEVLELSEVLYVAG